MAKIFPENENSNPGTHHSRMYRQVYSYTDTKSSLSFSLDWWKKPVETQKSKVLSWALNPDRVGRFRKLAGSKFQTLLNDYHSPSIPAGACAVCIQQSSYQNATHFAFLLSSENQIAHGYKWLVDHDSDCTFHSYVCPCTCMAFLPSSGDNVQYDSASSLSHLHLCITPYVYMRKWTLLCFVVFHVFKIGTSAFTL